MTTLPPHVIEAAAGALYEAEHPTRTRYTWRNVDVPDRKRYVDQAEAAISAALAALWQPIESFDLPDYEQCLLWQAGWMLSPVVIGWRVEETWLCEAFDINSEHQRPTHWAPSIPLPQEGKSD